MQRALRYGFACFLLISTNIQAQTSVTQIKSSQCGATLSSINSLIYAVCKPQVTAYRFEVTDTRTNTIQVIDRGLQYFSLNMLPYYDYATPYSIRVELQISGVWTGTFGSSCVVYSPDILSVSGAAQIVPSQCGYVLANINTLISTTSLQGVTGYRFRVTNITDPNAPNQVQVIDRGLQWFSLPMLSSYNYATNYLVEVAVKTTGSFSAFGNPCQVSAPDVPSLVSCGESITDSATMISIPSLSKVTAYRFEVTNLDTGFITIIDRIQNRFSFSNIPDYSSATPYGVRVAVMTSGEYSPFGDACEISSPGEAKHVNGKSLEDIGTENSFNTVAYPNPFSDNFNISIRSASSEDLIVKTYDMLGRLIEKQSIRMADVESTKIGNQYPQGIYTVVVSQGQSTKILRTVKP